MLSEDSQRQTPLAFLARRLLYINNSGCFIDSNYCVLYSGHD
jgi:hypothetical protein